MRMLLVDAIMSKTTLKQQLILSFIMSILICLTVGNMYVITPLFVCLMTFSAFFGLFMGDERGNWESYRLAMLLGKRQVVCGRYVYFIVLNIASLLLALIFVGLLYLLEPHIGTMLPPDFSSSINGLNWQILLAMCALPVCILVLTLSIVLPITFRSGMSKAMIWLPMIIIMGTIGLGAAIQNLDLLQNPDFLRVVTWVTKPEGTLIAILSLVIVAFAAYLLSCFIAVGIYKNRQF